MVIYKSALRSDKYKLITGMKGRDRRERKKIKIIFKLVTFHLTHIGWNPILTRGMGIHSDDVMVKSCELMSLVVLALFPENYSSQYVTNGQLWSNWPSLLCQKDSGLLGHIFPFVLTGFISE